MKSKGFYLGVLVGMFLTTAIILTVMILISLTVEF